MDFPLQNTSSSGANISGQLGSGSSVGGVSSSPNAQLAGSLGVDDNSNFASSQYAGVPLSAASLNAMMAGAQLPGGSHGHSQASALNSSLAAQYSAAAGMFPSSMIGANGMAAGASMFPSGGGGMGGMGGMSAAMGGMSGMGGMGAMGGMTSSNGMSIGTNMLGLSSAGSMQNSAFMAGRSPFLLSNGTNMNINGALGGQFPQGNAMGNLNGSSLLTQLPNNADINGAGNDKLALANGDASAAASTGGAAGSQAPNGLPTILSKYWNLQQPIPSVLMENEPSERPYRDHALIPEDQSSRNGNRRLSSGHGKEKSGGSNFPAKLHEILSRTDIADIISWSPHGRAWRVLKPKAFEEKIIPKYFRHCKYNSFTRQVNGWGFRRITQGPDHNAYFHELFLRGLPHLCKRMRRLTASSSSRSDLMSSIEPDFYSMSKISPLPAIGSGIASEPASNNMGRKLFSEENGVSRMKSGAGSTGSGEGKDDDDNVGNNSSSPISANGVSENGLVVKNMNKNPSDPKSRQLDVGAENGVNGDSLLNHPGAGNTVTPEMMHELQAGVVNANGANAGNGEGISESTNNDFSQLDSFSRQQLLQAQYLNSMNMRQDTLQQQILAQQSLLSSLQGHQGLSQIAGGGLGVGVPGMGMGMGMGMGLPGNAQMPSLMGAGASGGASFPMNGNQGSVLSGSNQNGLNAGSNLQFY